MNESISLSPHIGAATKEAQERIGIELAEQIISILKDMLTPCKISGKFEVPTSASPARTAADYQIENDDQSHKIRKREKIKL